MPFIGRNLSGKAQTLMRPLGPGSGSFVPRNRVFLNFSTHLRFLSKFEEDKSQLLRSCFGQVRNIVKVWMPVENNGCFGVWLKQNKISV